MEAPPQANLLLVGMPGSGKTTYGRQLAELSGKTFYDTDQAIAEQQGLSVSDIFAHFGEHYFRQQEAQLLAQIEPEANRVVATGGGMPCFFNNMERINALGLSIFLDTPLSAIFSRMSGKEQRQRPILNNKQGETLFDNLERKYRNRQNFYRQAQWSIDPMAFPPDQLLEALQNQQPKEALRI